MTSGRALRTGPDRLRVVPWRGRVDVALVNPVPSGPAPRPSTIDRCLASLGSRGVREVVTGALAPAEQAPFLEVGFVVRERLLLLAHPMEAIPAAGGGPRTTRARRGDRRAILAVDRRAFSPFWRLDGPGLDDAVAATAAGRVRVVASSTIVGYAVTGRSGARGYIQRVAVDPGHHREGIGTALVLDGLRWLRRHGVDRAVVNTQEDNHTAQQLYLGLGFRPEPDGLAVLTRPLGGPVR